MKSCYLVRLEIPAQRSSGRHPAKKMRWGGWAIVDDERTSPAFSLTKLLSFECGEIQCAGSRGIILYTFSTATRPYTKDALCFCHCAAGWIFLWCSRASLVSPPAQSRRTHPVDTDGIFMPTLSVVSMRR